MALVFVDVEARGTSPVNGTMTEFGAVVYDTRGKHHKAHFHGRLFDGAPDEDNPSIPVIGEKIADDREVAEQLIEWLKVVSPGQVTLVSDNPAYDFMWMAGMFDRAGLPNPFGHSGRRISDFWAGFNKNWGDTQSWKRFRITKHDHNPVNDSMGNVEAFEKIMELNKEARKLLEK